MKLVKFVLFISIVASCLTGCGKTEPSSFYLLNPIHNSNHASATKKPLGVAIGPVKYPQHLRNPQIVTRKGKHQLEQNEFHRWAEPLDKNVKRVLAENLSNLIPGSNILFYPWKGYEKVNVQVKINVNDFAMKEDGKSLLRVSWSLHTPDHKMIGHVHKNVYRSRSKNISDYNATVVAMNKNLNDFSRDLARAIKSA